MTKEEIQAKIKACADKLQALKAKERTTEVINEANQLAVEFKDLQAKLDAENAFDILDGFNAEPQPKVKPATVSTVEASAREKGTHGYGSKNEFYNSVIKAARTGDKDERLTKYVDTAFEKHGEDGGFLIPVDFREEIKEKVMADDSLLSRTDMYNTSRTRLEFPISETAAWDASGIQAYWEEEGQTHKDSKEVFGNIDLRVKPIAAMVKLTEDLMEDAPALESFITKKTPEAFTSKINSALVAGDGAGKPTGFLNSGFKITVAPEGGQASDEIVYENINKMWSAMLPQSRANAVWIYNGGVEEKLRNVSFGVQEIPVFIPPGGLSSTPYGTLMGRPALPMMGAMKALGVEGDIALVDLKYYITAVRSSGIKQDVSTHVFFDQSKVALKFRMRMDGQCPFKSPVQAEHGDHKASAFVTLGDR